MKNTNTNYRTIAKMTSFFLLKKFDGEIPEPDVFDILKYNDLESIGFTNVVDYFSEFNKTDDEVDLSQLIAESFYQTDACDTCYCGFERWLTNKKDYDMDQLLQNAYDKKLRQID